ncbi:hypothetical protein BD626DRAFT_515025 [Schizophyllum amplum]|uniref:Uncharacterized protein n=1 Tax=Schizophyllum amplum TaxID=97359 RepID=A0A550BY92_9AGAR|nr:hypothetical protein BD626DRAFT_515025 [Auriculariopsis ampla]
MLNAFKLKAFDLEPVYTEWTTGHDSQADPTRDKPVDEWLEAIKAGCKARDVPKECWHKVGQHFMGEKARARLDELKAVMAKVNGGTYRWSWEKFKIAMRNMGWNIDASETESIKVEAKSSGQWWFSRKNGQKEQMDAAALSPVVESPVDTEPATSAPWTLRRALTSRSITGKTSRPRAVKPKRRHTDAPSHPSRDECKSRRANSQTRSGETCSHCSCDSHSHSGSKKRSSSHTGRGSEDGSRKSGKTHREGRPVPSHSKSEPSKLNTETVIATQPVAAEADERRAPKAMSTLGAILITVGTIPAIPALHVGAGGAFLASGAIQAAGAIAVGVGKLLTTVGKSAEPQPAVEGKETGKITQA